ncbi:MAG: substrate-binding domain-containing protein [Armatimonadetes bacterium]|nr:substrate-binding domain-containing protein [Armatimonadota bacterium]
MRRAIAAVVVAAALLPGCSGPAKDGAKSETKGEAKKYVIGMSQCNLGEPWRQQMNKDIEAAAAKHPEIEMIFRDAQNKSETQQSQMREFVQQKVDLIIISPKESRPLVKPVSDAMAAGIPVIVLDRKLESDNFTCFIGADNVKIGREAGRELAKQLGGKGSIVELKGLMTSIPGHERHNGFMEGIKGTQIQTIFEADCGWLEPNAQREMKSALSRFDQIDAVYGHNDPSAHGAYMAAKQEGKGRENSIKFVGIDALPDEGVRYVKKGILALTFQYPTGGAEAIDTALKILKGEKVEKTITLGTRMFNKENVEAGGATL